MPEKKDKVTTMNEWGFTPTLVNTLQNLDNTSRNALAVEAKVRPLTINEIANGQAKQVNFATLSKILDALNRMATEKGIDKKYSVTDIFEYDSESKKPTE